MADYIILIVDESAAMAEPCRRMGENGNQGQGAAKPKAHIVATAVNVFLSKMAANSSAQIALIGYATQPNDELLVGTRWQGGAAGGDFVSSADLSRIEVTREVRLRRVLGPGGLMEEQEFEFPIWYQPQTSGKSPQVAAFECCAGLLANCKVEDKERPPLIVHITCGNSSDGNPTGVIRQITSHESQPVLFQVHLRSSDIVPPTVFPANRAHTAQGAMRDMFDRCSPLPQSVHEISAAQGRVLNPKARAMVYNASMLELTMLLSLLTTYLQESTLEVRDTSATAPDNNQQASDTIVLEAEPEDTSSLSEEPQGTGESPVIALPPEDEDPAQGSITSDAPALITFVFDRSVEDPYSTNINNVCSRLQATMSHMLAEVARIGGSAIHVGLVSYGGDATGEPDVRLGWEGQAMGREFVNANELENLAIRIEQFHEERFDGVSGIIQIPRKRFVMVELESATKTPPAPGFAAARKLFDQWRAMHPGATFPPLLIHLTRGEFGSDELQEAMGDLQGGSDSNGPRMYNLVVTESPHVTVLCPENPDALNRPELMSLWKISSPLLYRRELAATKNYIGHGSRGLIINGEFDLLLNGIKRGLAV